MATRKRRVAQTPSARTLRSATAYFRLARKQQIAGERDTHTDHALRLQALGYRQREAEERRLAEKAERIKNHKPTRS